MACYKNNERAPLLIRKQTTNIMLICHFSTNFYYGKIAKMGQLKQTLFVGVLVVTIISGVFGTSQKQLFGGF